MRPVLRSLGWEFDSGATANVKQRKGNRRHDTKGATAQNQDGGGRSIPARLILFPLCQGFRFRLIDHEKDLAAQGLEEVLFALGERAVKIAGEAALLLHEASAVRIDVKSALISADEPQSGRAVRPAASIKWAVWHG